ncbi:MAG TPA: divergent polysaccharide deacetylase family protein [Rhizomicrobium sp.]|nr:divergent polysaccharide deacetylase family protein [Rhizomicrobium sp.]
MASSSISYRDDIGRASPLLTGRLLAFVYLGVFGLFLLILVVVALWGRASDGDPVARLVMPSRPHLMRARHAAAEQPEPAAIKNVPPATVSPENPPGVLPPPVRPVVPPPAAAGTNPADPALIEQTPQGPLPRIGNDGRTPMMAYAPFVPSTRAPRIAVVISGLGISAKGTALAIEELPPMVTLAFAPYENDVQRWVAQARARGHEVLLEVPMEPFDFPDSDPGPHTLRAAVGEETNTQRLVWSLTRFTGYAGITNLLGGRLLADEDSLAPIMTYVSRRGLMFFDSGPQNRSVAPEVARRINAPYVQSEITLDTIQTGMEIDARLSELEKLARTNGSAAATGFLVPVTVDRVANWAKGLEGRGVVLVPASAIVAQGK